MKSQNYYSLNGDNTATLLIIRRDKSEYNVTFNREDYELVQSKQWRVGNASGGRPSYAVTGKKQQAFARLVLGLSFNDPRQAAHLNGDSWDCRRSNLQVVQNASQLRSSRVDRTEFNSRC